MSEEQDLKTYRVATVRRVVNLEICEVKAKSPRAALDAALNAPTIKTIELHNEARVPIPGVIEITDRGLADDGQGELLRVSEWDDYVMRQNINTWRS